MATLDDARAIATTSDGDERRPLLLDAWRMGVSKEVAAAYDEQLQSSAGPTTWNSIR